MPWLRLDDKFAQHPKISDLSDRAFRVHVVTMLYCSEYATKGRIPKAALGLAGARGKVIEELVSAGVWDREDEQLFVHDFEIYNGISTETRVAAFLKRFPGTTANEVHRAIGGKREVVLALVARFQSGSQSGTPEPENPGSPGTTEAVPLARARESSPLAVESSLEAERSEVPANYLPIEKERVTTELLAAIGSDADEGTPRVLRSVAVQLPEGVLAKVLESLRKAKPNDRAAYVVGALKAELATRQPPVPKTAKLRKNPERYVRELGFRMEADVLDEVLLELVPDESERKRLTELASDLRKSKGAVA